MASLAVEGALELAEATLELIEMHVRQRARQRAVAKQHRRIVRMLRARWRRQLKSIIEAQQLRSLYTREAIEPGVAAAIVRLMLPEIARHALEGLVSGPEVEIFDKALRVAFGAGAAATALDLDRLLSSADLAEPERRWIQTRGFERLAKDVDQTTRDRLRDAVAKAYQDGGSYDELVRTIKSTFRDFSDTRADLIAQTELNAAYNQGGLELAREVNARWKRWNPLGSNVCPICRGNEAQGKLALDAAFQGGAASPPQHPRCQCVLDFGFLDPE
jgi:hypothetical protein